MTAIFITSMVISGVAFVGIIAMDVKQFFKDN